MNIRLNKFLRRVRITAAIAAPFTAILFAGNAGFAFAQTTTDMMPANTASSSYQYHVMIMKHLCNANIKNVQDFANLEAGRDPVAALANTVLNCPTTGLPADAAASGTVASPRSTYSFTVQSGSTMKTLSDGTFMQHKLCESDIKVDVNGDGNISSSTCLDISHYDIPITTTSTQISVMETQPPGGFHFGTLRFTPTALDGNNDSGDLASIDSSSGTINLNMAQDKDGMVMLHIYNFVGASTTPMTMTTTTTSTSMSSSSISFENLSQASIKSLIQQIAQINDELARLRQTLQRVFGGSHAQQQ